MEQLKQDLNDKCESCYLYSQEIEKLQLCIKETITLRLEKESLLVSYYLYLKLKFSKKIFFLNIYFFYIIEKSTRHGRISKKL